MRAILRISRRNDNGLRSHLVVDFHQAMSLPSHAAIPLEHPPEIISAGYASHGTHKRESYRFEDYGCLHLYHYHLRLELDRQECRLEPGDMTVIPPKTRMVFHFSEPGCRHYYALFHALPRGAGVPIAIIQRAPAEREAITADFRAVASGHASRPAMARARLWSILWRLAETKESGASEGAGNEFFREACARIGRNLGSPVTVSGLARDLGVSHNHLTRLFRRHAGTTVIGYLRDQRMARAQYLLRQSTLPVKRIAFECGIPDLHLFNKTVRHAFGCSPRRLRETKEGGHPRSR